jgi:serine/threonine protein phosphatase PrpC
LDSDHTGSTATIALFRIETGRRVVYVANLGDSRAILISGASQVERLSYDHRATDKAEIERVKRDGGIVIDDRVAGSLAVTRAFGDHALKRDGVIAKPSIKKHHLRPSDRYLVIASDGIWDALEDTQVFKLCRDELNTREIAQSIIKTAIECGSTDNCSCLVIKFNSASPF